MDDMKPGNIVIPHNADDPQPQPQPSGAPEPRPEEGPAEGPGPAPEPTAPDTTIRDSFQAPADATLPAESVGPASGWRFSHSAAVGAPESSLPNDITWTASEFIAHEKNLTWYGRLVLVGVGLAAIDYFWLKDVVSTFVILFATIIFGVISAAKPRTQQYVLTHQGLSIGKKEYHFQDFKNFSVVEEGAIASIVFMPLKRFMPPLTIYVSPDMEEQILDFLSIILPFEEHKPDPVDSLMRHIRF